MLSGLNLLEGTNTQPVKTGLDLLKDHSKIEQTKPKSGLDLLQATVPSTSAPTTKLPIESSAHPAATYLKKFTKPPTSELETARYQMGPLIRPQDTAPAMDTLGRLWNLAQHPYDVVKGSAMFASEIPGFMGGLASAMGQVPISILMGIGKGKTVLDWYNASAQNMATISGMWHQGVSAPLGKLLELPEEAGKRLSEALVGAKPEAHKDESQLVGEIAMVPLTAASAPIHALADSPTFADHPNARGLLKFSADVAGLITGGLVYNGGPAMFARDIDPIVKKADTLDARGKAIDSSGLDEVIKDAQRKVLEADKKQLDLEAAKVAKNLDLGKLTEEEEVIRAERLDRAKQRALAELEVAAEEVPKPKVKLKKIEPRPVKVEPPEPITDLDLQTGLEEPLELSTHQSPFRDTPELTQQKKAMYAEHAKSVTANPQLMANKLLNDVNRWLDGEELPVEDVRNNLSELAARADELKNDFRDNDSFERWKSNVSDAATWARKADRSKIEWTTSGINLNDIGGAVGEGLRDTYKKLKRLHPAPFPQKIQKIMAEIATDLGVSDILDIFGGIGNIGNIKKYGYKGLIRANELEPYWSGKSTIELQKSRGVDVSTIGDSRHLDLPDKSVESIFTSPTYGNLMGSRSPSKKDNYLTFAGGKLGEGSTAGEIWGPVYEQLHKDIYKEAYRVVKPGGYFILNMKDRPTKNVKNRWIPKKGSTVKIVGGFMKSNDWHIKALEDVGFVFIKSIKVKEAKPMLAKYGHTKKFTFGYESISVLQKPIGEIKIKDRSKIEQTLPSVRLDIMIPLDQIPKAVMNFYKGIKNLKVRNVFRDKELFDKTGFWLGRDGFWRYEIDDSKAKFVKSFLPPKPGYTTIKIGTHKLGDIYKHPELYKAFPELKDMDVVVTSRLKDGKGVYYASTNQIKISDMYDVPLAKKLLSHEIQHAVNEKMGAFPGTNIETAGQEGYLKTPGEMEARLTEARQSMSLEEMTETPPWETLDDILKLEKLPERSGTKLYSGIPVDEFIHMFRGAREKLKPVKGFDKDETATEGVGIYATPDRSLAEQFGKVKHIVYRKPKNPLNVIDEELPLLSESDILFEPIKETDSTWIKFNKEAVIRSGVSDANWNPAKVARELTNVLKEKGYDAINVNSFGDEWSVILDKGLIDTKRSEIKLYNGLPIDEISKQVKSISKHAVKSVREFKNSFKEKEFDFGHAVKQVKADSVRALWDQSETLLNMVKNKYPQEYERIVTRQRSAVTGIGYGKVLYGQAVKEIYGGKSKAEIDAINFYVLIKRFADIYKYRPETGYKHQPGYGFTEVSNAAAIIEMAQNMPPSVWEKIINKSSDMKEIFGNLTPEQIKGVVKAGKAYFEWSRSIIDDLVDIGIKTPEEGVLLKSHNFRKFKTILVKKLYDFKYNLQLKGESIKVNNSGVLDLGAGSTKIIEPDSRVVLSEQMARAYGSIAHQRAMLEWKGLADRHSDNGFVSTKQQSGWSPIPYVANGVRKNLYFHPDVVKYLVTRSRDISPRLATVIRALSFAPITRALAVGTSPIWSTFAGLPMDVMHSLWTARTWEADAKGIRPKATFPFYETKEGKFKRVYSPFTGVSELQLGHDMKRTLGDVYSRGPLTTNLMKHGLVMNFLTQRQNRYMKGVRPPGDWAKTMDLLSSHGLSMELWVRVATADRVIRRDAKKLEITYEQALRNDDIMYRAAHAGRDRMDYNQGGWLVKALDQSGMIFLNAAVLGARTFWRQAKDNPVDFWFRTAQIGLTATGITAAAWSLYPEEMKDQSKKGSRRDVTWPIAPNWLRVKDRDGNDVTFYGKMRMDPNAAIIYRFFEGLTRTYMYDKGLTNVEPDYRELVKSIKQLGPIDVKAPPHVQFWYDYITNYKWWQDRQMYKEMGGKTFDWPQSRHEGEFDERVSQMAKDIGKVTGMSPVRGGEAISNIIPSNNEFVWLTGKAYETAFSDVPKEVRSQHWLITLAETPGFNKVVGITRHGQGRWKVKSDVEDEIDLKRIVRNGKFDMLATRNAWFGVKNSKKLNEFMKEQEFDVYNDMVDTLKFMNDPVVKSLPHRDFWLSMKHSSIEGRAKIWIELLNEASEGEKKQLMSEVDQLGLVGGIVTPKFMDKVMEIQGQGH